MEIQQNQDNTYTFTLKVLPKLDSEEANQNNPTTTLVSQIELNPEDIIVLQKFINVFTIFHRIRNVLMNFSIFECEI